MRAYFVLLSILFSTSILFISCGKDDSEPKVDPEDNEINTWIYEVMEKNYLWYEDLPAKASLDFSKDPEEFFNGLRSDKDGVIYNQKHLYFSTIEKKHETTKALSEYEPTYGFEFVAYTPEAGKYWIQILYVLAGSVADKAGLKRGDWITSLGVNKEKITDYSVLQSGGSVVVNTANLVNNTLIPQGQVTLEAAKVMEVNPFIKDTVLSIGGKTIGYLAYTHFASGPNDNENKAYDNQMKEIFTRFKTKQVNEFVLDLRYNGGGLVSSSMLLSSLLAPSTALGQVFGYMEYNDKNTSSNLELRFEKASAVSASNLNLNRLYVLTGDWTASASEAVINMLYPYMPGGRAGIHLIGTKTIGKTVGSNTFGDDKDFGYLLHPIVLRIYNKDHLADYDNGFEPDTEIDEFETDNTLAPLGTPQELLFGEAIRQITGSTLKQVAISGASPFGRPVYSSLDGRGIKGLILDSTTK